MIYKNTFSYIISLLDIAKLNEWIMEFIRDTVVSSCIVTPSSFWSSFPVWPISWAAFDTSNIESIAVFVLFEVILIKNIINFNIYFLFTFWFFTIAMYLPRYIHLLYVLNPSNYIVQFNCGQFVMTFDFSKHNLEKKAHYSWTN